MSFSPSSNRMAKKRMTDRLKRTTGVGKKRIKKLTRIERRQRRRFNKIINCPSCHEHFGTNIGCVACQLKRGQKNDIF